MEDEEFEVGSTYVWANATCDDYYPPTVKQLSDSYYAAIYWETINMPETESQITVLRKDITVDGHSPCYIVIWENIKTKKIMTSFLAKMPNQMKYFKKVEPEINDEEHAGMYYNAYTDRWSYL